MESQIEHATAPVSNIKAKTIHVTVQAGSAREFPISVFAGCMVEYSFHTKGGDIAFGILLETPDKVLKTVLERERVPAHEEALSGKVKCTQSGTLWFMWDNTHSWFTSKELVYSVTRQPSDFESTSSSASSSKMKIVLGTMTMASQVDAQNSLQMLKRFSEMNQEQEEVEIDTARMYNKGKTEILLGEVMRSMDESVNSRLKIASKANPFPGFNENLKPENVKKQLNDTLNVLQRDEIDIFYLHSPDHSTDILETLRAVQDLFDEKKFARFGLSNYAAWEVMEIYNICKREKYVLPTVYQGMYNALTREVEKELLPCLKKLKIAFYAYNPLAGGLLSGRYSEALVNLSPKQGRFSQRMYQLRYWNEEYLEAAALVQKVCEECDISLADASLAWLTKHSKIDPSSGAVIIGASKMEHLEQNVKALQSANALPPSVLEAFDQAWKKCKGCCPSYNR